MEKLVREFNYPSESHIRSEEDVERMGIKAFFCSDVCAAYNRKIYEELGGFVYPLKTNEDMFFAAQAIRGGYRVAYAAEARVLHSHNFSLKEQYERNRIQGYEIERHRPLLGNVSKVSEGFRLARFVSGGLLRRGRVLSFARFGLDCFARLFGSRAGRRQFLKENQQA
jgi:rhamnosyltransferase